MLAEGHNGARKGSRRILNWTKLRNNSLDELRLVTPPLTQISGKHAKVDIQDLSEDSRSCCWVSCIG